MTRPNDLEQLGWLFRDFKFGAANFLKVQTIPLV